MNVENKKLKDKNQEVEAKCVGLQKAAEAKEQARVELEGQLVQLTKAEKSQRTTYRVKVPQKHHISSNLPIFCIFIIVTNSVLYRWWHSYWAFGSCC